MKKPATHLTLFILETPCLGQQEITSTEHQSRTFTHRSMLRARTIVCNRKVPWTLMYRHERRTFTSYSCVRHRHALLRQQETEHFSINRGRVPRPRKEATCTRTCPAQHSRHSGDQTDFSYIYVTEVCLIYIRDNTRSLLARTHGCGACVRFRLCCSCLCRHVAFVDVSWQGALLPFDQLDGRQVRMSGTYCCVFLIKPLRCKA